MPDISLDWPADRLRELADSARMQRHRRRALIGREKDRRDTLVVVSGSIEISATNSTGAKYILTVAGPGQVVNLVQLLKDVPTIFAYVAREDSQVIHIPAPTEAGSGRGTGALAEHRRAHAAKIHLRRRIPSLRRRTAITLINLAHRFGEQPIGSGNTELHISQTDLANMLGMSRQTVGKELVRLKDEGILGDGEGYHLITLLDVPALLRIAEED